MNETKNWAIIQGDALKVLEGFAPGTFDAVITDPPYASGGRTQAEKNKSTTQKYSSMKNAPPPFDGDAKDQRSWTRWAGGMAVPGPKSLQARHAGLYVYRLAAAPGSYRCPPVGRLDLAGDCCLGQGQQPSPEGALPAAGGVYRLGQQRGYAYLPTRTVPARSV